MKIKVACNGSQLAPIERLKPIQGNLKTLTKRNYEKLRGEILTSGYSEPISCWKSNESFLILNGHQRYFCLMAMKKDGYEIPPIPINLVYANTKKEALRKVLSLTSQYGELNREGLYEFMHEADINIDELSESFSFPEIDLNKFKLEFFDDKKILKEKKRKEVICVHCGKSFEI